MYCSKKITVVIPALNEEKSIAYVINDLPKDIVDEIVVVDNGCVDNTVAVAKEAGATVLKESKKGYGAACLKGINASTGTDIVVILDADYSDYPDRVSQLLDPIVKEGYDMVLGSRTLGNAQKGSMSFPQIWGNKLAVFLMHCFCGYRYSDMGPFRAIRFDSLKRLAMEDENYGWNVEMQMKAVKEGLKIKEIAVDYRNRIGKSKISGTVSGVIKAGTKIIYSVVKYA